jgi:hypothetical protein
MVICWKLSTRERLTSRISGEEAVINKSFGMIISEGNRKAQPS